jgi:alpha-tubulin suppressor-like RCC1 family protein
MRSSTLFAGCFALALAAACSDTPTGGAAGPAALASAVTLADSSVAGAAADVAVLVTDAANRPVPGAAVDFLVTAGGGQVAAARVQADAEGIARTAWTTGAMEGTTNTLVASLVEVPAARVTFSTRGARVQPQVSAGVSHTCALNSRGRAYCWGRDTNGQLGDDAETVNRLVPTPVAGGRTFWSISAGAQHTCGLATDQRVYCWGMGINGQLGTDKTVDSRVPAPLAVTGNAPFVHVASGGLHTCALTASGETWCWGRNLDGQLGAPAPLASAPAPRRVENAPAFVRLTAGDNHTCGLTAAGEAHCWGYNALGQLGDGTQQSRSSLARVPGMSFGTLEAGMGFTCGEALAGYTYCWGSDNGEQLGNGAAGSDCYIGQFHHRCSTTPTAVQPIRGYGVLALGERHACGLAPSGTAWCWGSNGSGQLGSGTTNPSWTALAVQHQQTYVDIGAGQFHTCAINASDVVQCWGGNDVGQLGDGTTTNRRVPESTAVSISQP